MKIIRHLREITAIFNRINWMSKLGEVTTDTPFILTVKKCLFNLHVESNVFQGLWLNALLRLRPLEYRNSDWLLVIVEGGIAQERVDISSDCGGRGGAGAYVTG